ncbi:MAG: DnaJ domain-containing protein [Armatimonadota bacterium]
MRDGRTPYEILGVAETATEQEIKRRYRELVRQHHPDVSQEKSAAHARFVAIAEAYRVLSDAETRAQVDAILRQAPRRRPGWRPQPVLSPLARARLRFDERDYEQALLLCAEALESTPEDPEVHLLIARIYRAQGREDLAQRAFARARRLGAPIRGSESSRVSPPPDAERAEPIDVPAAPPTRLRKGALGVGWGALAGLGALAWMAQPGQEALGVSWAVVGACIGGGSLVGALLGGHGWLGSFDDELGMPVPAPGRTRLPVGVLVALASLLAAPLGLVVALVAGALADRFLRGTVVALLAALCWTGLVGAAIYLGDMRLSALYAPGVGLAGLAMVAALAGWALASVFRPEVWD